MPHPIRLLIVDDHNVVRRGLRAYLEDEPDLEIAGEAANGVEAVRLAETLQPEVILMDLVMPGGGGLEAIAAIRRKNPDARILVLTSFAEDSQVFAAIRAGALGYLLKDSTPESLVHAIHEVHQGLPSLHPIVAQKLMAEVVWNPASPPDDATLSDRELEVLEALAHGLTNQAIADKLSISERTVRTHVSHILSKLHVANRTQAALYAKRRRSPST